MADDPKNIWQNQKSEGSRMTLEMMQRRAAELHLKTRRQLLVSLLMPVIMVLLCWQPLTGQNQSALLAALAVVLWSLAGAYFLQRGLGGVTSAGEVAALECYRQELERQQKVFRRVLLWFFGPVVSGIGVFLSSITGTALRENLPKAAPFITVVVVWAVAFLLMKMRDEAALARERRAVEDLDPPQR